VLARYSLYGVAWSVVAALFAIGMSFRYREKIELVAHGREWLVWLVMGAVWIAVFMPVVILVGRPLVERWRRED
jgi:putative peptide zinc metalloprotease protein